MTNEYTATEGESVLIESIVAAYMREQCGWQNAFEYHGHTDCWKKGVNAALALLTPHDAGVRATALEEAAQIADRQQYADGLVHPDMITEDIERIADARARAIAAAIRAVQENPGKDNQ